MKQFHWLAVIGLVLTGGCYNWRDEVSKQAAFDHRCPTENVQILRNTDDAMARSVELDVCGNARMYRDVGGGEIYLWHDVTENDDSIEPAE